MEFNDKKKKKKIRIDTFSNTFRAVMIFLILSGMAPIFPNGS